MRLLIDEDVPDDVAKFLETRSHEVLRVRENFLPQTEDDVLAKWAHENKAVIVTWDKHFRNKWIQRRPPDLKGERFYNLGRISFHKCAESRGELRIRQTIDVIEFEYQHRQTLIDRRIIVEIFQDRLVLW